MRVIGASKGGTSLFQIASGQYVLEESCQGDKRTTLGLAKNHIQTYEHTRHGAATHLCRCNCGF